VPFKTMEGFVDEKKNGIEKTEKKCRKKKGSKGENVDIKIPKLKRQKKNVQ
jgi:hypothetical protein